MHKKKKLQSSKKTSEPDDAKYDGLIYNALSSPKWDYRTACGISKETGIPLNKLELKLNNSNAIRESILKSKTGEKLYALRKRKSWLGDHWSAFLSLNSDKFGDEE